MRLSQIKLAGFKSFVDATVIHLPSNRIGIVGPNGCGKSNVVDAVRWVMGESSAKSLRGEAMADVIFAGAANRHAAKQAAVELIFEEAEGKLPGALSDSKTVSIKRLLTRDGQSHYFINQQRCRRRDITNLFLGTGLGTNSYAIIEQGMISRIIESRPEDLRAFLEEGAEISRYKEKRKESEQHLQEVENNLTRLTDIRHELKQRLEELHDQAQTAALYQKLKNEETRFKSEMLATRWQQLNQEEAKQEQEIQHCHDKLNQLTEEKTALDSEWTLLDAHRHNLVTQAATLQETFYQLENQVNREQQTLQHNQNQQINQQQALKKLQLQWDKTYQESLQEQAKWEQCQQTLQEHQESHEKWLGQNNRLKESLAQRDNEYQSVQQTKEKLTQQYHQAEQSIQVEQTKIQSFHEQKARINQQMVQLEEEHHQLLQSHDEQELTQYQETLQKEERSLATQIEQRDVLQQAIQTLRHQQQALNHEITAHQATLHACIGKLSSLEALQASALGKDQQDQPQEPMLRTAPRLGEKIGVVSGWERAVEIVLSGYLQAIGVEKLEEIVDLLANRNENLVFTEMTSVTDCNSKDLLPRWETFPLLMSKIDSPWRLPDFLYTIYAVPDLATALAEKHRLPAGCSMITPEGDWVGHHWLQHFSSQASCGVLLREQVIKELHQEKNALQQTIETLILQQTASRNQLELKEKDRETTQKQIDQHTQRQRDLHTVIAILQQKLLARKERLAELLQALSHLRQQSVQDQTLLQEAEIRLSQASQQTDSFKEQLQQCQQNHHHSQEEVERLRHELAHGEKTIKEIAVHLEREKTTSAMMKTHLTRLEKELAGLKLQQADLTKTLESEVPLEAIQQRLQQSQKDYQATALEREATKQQLEQCEQAHKKLYQQKDHVAEKIVQHKEFLEKLKLHRQEITIRRENLVEQSQALAIASLEDYTKNLSESSSIEYYQRKLAALQQEIAKLGAVNLAAIEESTRLDERSRYLQQQEGDLQQGVGALREAIRKMDEEMEKRFLHTFSQVNVKLKSIFPRLFGGGEGYLQLTSKDPLSAGITIMARPPGKQIRQISLLSGGEKALTALAFIFALFELNPSPFCLLDEVDAPLDEANIGRFCTLVQEKSETIQFIFITHNKATMELANQLNGVTMQEPGISRLVSVDLDRAAELAGTYTS